MSASQFEQSVSLVQAEAAAIGDQEAVSYLTTLAMMWRQGDRWGVHAAYASLRPIYRERLGPLPTVPVEPRPIEPRPVEPRQEQRDEPPPPAATHD
ncbi:MAG: hypothetical protein IT456_01950 [Planctomycetes bacterium]|nr:hypothetical protein [Planctomycetota bacterium]